MMNQYLINPAVAGTSDHYDVRLGHRSQWVNLQGAPSGIAPQTSYVSGHFHLGQHIGPNRGRHRNEKQWHHGLGAMVVYDKTGPTTNTSAYGTYTHNLYITKKLKISFGASIGFQQFRIDGSQLTTSDQNTGNIGSIQKIVPDMSFGYWLYHERYYFGASINQIFQNKLNSSYYNGVNKLNNHYFITGGYLLGLHTNLHIIPSFLIKYVSPAPVSFDINCKVRWQDQVWAGISYRKDDAVVFLAGVTIKRTVDIGYSYDYGISDLSKLSGGSHEVMIGLRFNPKAFIMSPSDFW
jgi:type IX secretion system PorP/SprF family membrane protein